MPSAQGERCDVFISYSTRNKKVAEKLELAFRSAGLSVWRDDGKLNAGDTFPAEIAEAIAECRTVVFLASVHSVKSPWVKRELSYASEHKKPIIPVHLDADVSRLMPGSLGILLSGIHYIRLNDGDVERQISELVKMVKDGRFERLYSSHPGKHRKRLSSLVGLAFEAVFSLSVLLMCVTSFAVPHVEPELCGPPKPPWYRMPDNSPSPDVIPDPSEGPNHVSVTPYVPPGRFVPPLPYVDPWQQNGPSQRGVPLPYVDPRLYVPRWQPGAGIGQGKTLYNSFGGKGG